jgi:hypothetical protein
MTTSNRSAAVGPHQLWLPRPDGAGPWRWGCIFLCASIGLMPGIFTLANGHGPAAGALIALDVIMTLFVLSWPVPVGAMLTTDAVRLEQRNLFRREGARLPRSAWKELWLEEVGEGQARLYLYALAPDGQPVALPLSRATREEVQHRCLAATELLRLQVVAAFLPPATIPEEKSFAAAAAGGFAAHHAAEGRIERAAIRAAADPTSGNYEFAAANRKIRRELAILRGFGSLASPEAWLLSPERRTLTHQARDGGRTEHCLDEFVAVEVEPETIGDERGTDSDTTYLFAYRVNIVLASGKRATICRCASSEPRRSDNSQARRDAEWIAGSLRRMIASVNSAATGR